MTWPCRWIDLNQILKEMSGERGVGKGKLETAQPAPRNLMKPDSQNTFKESEL